MRRDKLFMFICIFGNTHFISIYFQDVVIDGEKKYNDKYVKYYLIKNRKNDIDFVALIIGRVF